MVFTKFRFFIVMKENDKPFDNHTKWSLRTRFRVCFNIKRAIGKVGWHCYANSVNLSVWKQSRPTFNSEICVHFCGFIIQPLRVCLFRCHFPSIRYGFIKMSVGHTCPTSRIFCTTCQKLFKTIFSKLCCRFSNRHALVYSNTNIRSLLSSSVLLVLLFGYSLLEQFQDFRCI